MEWLTRVGDRVTSIGPRVDGVAPSPSGALLAVFRARESDPDLVRRERVYVIERATGREVVALDGPEIFRGFAWVGDEQLLVVRDRDGGAALRLHTIPDGGSEAELIFSELSAGRVSIEVSADRSRALVAPWWMMSRRVSDARVVVLPSLAPLARVGERDVPEEAMADTLPLWATLDPDGARTLVLWGDFEEGGCLTIHPTDLRAPRPPAIKVDRAAGYDFASWLSRDSVLLASRETFDDEVLPCVLELARGEVYTLPTPVLHKGVIARALRPDPDGRRVAVLSQGAARDLHLSLVDLGTLRDTQPRRWRPSLRFAFALCWTSPDAIVTACAERGRVHLARWHPDGGAPFNLAAVEHAAPRSDFTLSPIGHTAVLLSQPHDPERFRVSFITVTP